MLDVIPEEQLLSHCRKVTANITKNSKLAVALATEQAAFASLFGTDDQGSRMTAYVKQHGAQKQ